MQPYMHRGNATKPAVAAQNKCSLGLISVNAPLGRTFQLDRSPLDDPHSLAHAKSTSMRRFALEMFFKRGRRRVATVATSEKLKGIVAEQLQKRRVMC